MLPKNKLLLLWFVKWLRKLLVSNAAGRKMWIWWIACHANCEITGRKIKFWKFFCGTNILIAPNDI